MKTIQIGHYLTTNSMHFSTEKNYNTLLEWLVLQDSIVEWEQHD